MVYQGQMQSFDGVRAFNARVAFANATRDQIIEQWRLAYDVFWQCPRTHGDRALSLSELQAVLDADQDEVGRMLEDSAAFLAFAQAAYPEAFVDPDPANPEVEAMIPPRYLSSPYEVSGIVGVNLSLVSLKSDWES